LRRRTVLRVLLDWQPVGCQSSKPTVSLMPVELTAGPPLDWRWAGRWQGQQPRPTTGPAGAWPPTRGSWSWGLFGPRLPAGRPVRLVTARRRFARPYVRPHGAVVSKIASPVGAVSSSLQTALVGTVPTALRPNLNDGRPDPGPGRDPDHRRWRLHQRQPARGHQGGAGIGSPCTPGSRRPTRARCPRSTQRAPPASPRWSIRPASQGRHRTTVRCSTSTWMRAATCGWIRDRRRRPRSDDGADP